MNYNQALEQMKLGRRVMRRGWNAHNTFWEWTNEKIYLIHEADEMLPTRIVVLAKVTDTDKAADDFEVVS